MAEVPFKQLTPQREMQSDLKLQQKKKLCLDKLPFSKDAATTSAIAGVSNAQPTTVMIPRITKEKADFHSPPNLIP